MFGIVRVSVAAALAVTLGFAWTVGQSGLAQTNTNLCELWHSFQFLPRYDSCEFQYVLVGLWSLAAIVGFVWLLFELFTLVRGLLSGGRPRLSLSLTEAAQFLYEEMEGTRVGQAADTVVGPTANDRLAYFINLLLNRKAPFRGKRPPSGIERLIDGESLPNASWIHGTNSLRISHDQVWEDVRVAKRHLSQELNFLRLLNSQLNEETPPTERRRMLLGISIVVLSLIGFVIGMTLIAKKGESSALDIGKEISPTQPAGAGSAPKPIRKAASRPMAMPSNVQALAGTAIFDYSTNNGLFEVGAGEFRFRLAFSAGGNKHVHMYTLNHKREANIEALARLRGVVPGQRASFYEFDSSSSSYTISEGEYFIAMSNENYLLGKIIDVLYERQGDDKDQVTFTYRINTDGGAEFDIT
jgi:hypothetical protein